ncbi:MAG: PaaI family thioesterase [Pseudomonadota bacterium]|nr:PaaI family thioesterase [Pseudomonadota bacterium]
MSVPEGFELLDIAARWGVDDAPDFVMHSGPIYVREDGSMPKLGFEVLPHMCNPGGVCHGGLLMTVLDNAFVFILHATLKRPVYMPSISCNFDFLAPAHLGEWVETSGSCTKYTKRTGFVSGALLGPDGPVLQGSGIFRITERTAADVSANTA